jgi:hypothetical protein
MNEYIQVLREDTTIVVQIDFIFIYKWDNKRRLFIKASPVKDNEDRHNEVLSYWVLWLQSGDLQKPLLIELPAIQPRNLYILSIITDNTVIASEMKYQKLRLRDSDDTDLLWIEQSVHYL